MATKTYTFSGIAMYPRLKSPDTKYKKYSIDLIMDEASYEKYKASGCQMDTLKKKKLMKEQEDRIVAGDERTVTFRRPTVTLFKDGPKEWGPVPTVDDKGNEIEGLVGNGSEVTISVDVFDTSQGPGSRLQSVTVHKMVEYKKPDEKDEPEVDLS